MLNSSFRLSSLDREDADGGLLELGAEFEVDGRGLSYDDAEVEGWGLSDVEVDGMGLSDVEVDVMGLSDVEVDGMGLSDVEVDGMGLSDVEVNGMGSGSVDRKVDLGFSLSQLRTMLGL